ncbi:restriction endonuclease subunit S [Methylosinus sp. RM1]|uniref:restriction endonuclease subunit S n=1 Tax=Methylosinus sp. RM1 TaxID=2583817 RepID=UPI00140D72A0
MRTAALGDLCEIIMGQAPSGETYNAEGDGAPLIAGASDFGEFSPKPKRHTTAPAKLSRVGDIILCVRATIGDLNWSDREYCLGRGVAGIRPNREKIDPSFAWWILHANAGNLAALGRGATFKQINRADIEGLEVSLPPLDEQRRIAAILDQANDLRRQRREAIAKLAKLSTGLFVELFGTPRISSASSSISDLGSISVFENGDRSSNYPSGDDILTSGIPFLSTKNIVDDKLDLGSLLFISSSKFASLSRGKARHNDLIITLRGTLALQLLFQMGSPCFGLVRSSP